MFGAVRLRLTLSIAGVIALVLLAVGALVYMLLSRQLDADVDGELRAAATRASVARGDVPVSDGVFAVLLLTEFAPPARRGATPATSGRWHEAGRTGPVPPGVPIEQAVDAARTGRDDLRTVEIDGQHYRVLTRAFGNEGRAFSVVQVGMSLAARDRQERIVLLALAGGSVLGLGLTVAGGLFLTGRALAPVRLAFDRQRRFVSDASHELRTPLALLRLEAEDLATRAGQGAEARPLLRQVDRVTRLVDDLLTLARLDEGALPLEREPLHVASVLNTAAAQARRLAAADVRVEVSAPADLWMSADPDRLHQVMLILVDNACRATPAGGCITLRGAPDGEAVLISVSDTGPGIPAEHKARVFERFYRADAARTRERGGAGLGLSIARDLVKAHGGEITLESRAGAGTTVGVRMGRPNPPAPFPRREGGALDGRDGDSVGVGPKPGV